MNPPISRREFLRGLTPSWLSKDVALAITIGLVIVAALAIAVSVLKDVGILGLGKGLVIAIGCMAVLWLTRRLIGLSKIAFDYLPPLLKAFLTVSFQFILCVIACGIGALVYERWQQVDERPEMLFTLAVVFVCSVIGEWNKRKSRAKNEP